MARRLLRTHDLLDACRVAVLARRADDHADRLLARSRKRWLSRHPARAVTREGLAASGIACGARPRELNAAVGWLHPDDRLKPLCRCCEQHVCNRAAVAKRADRAAQLREIHPVPLLANLVGELRLRRSESARDLRVDHAEQSIRRAPRVVEHEGELCEADQTGTRLRVADARLHAAKCRRRLLCAVREKSGLIRTDLNRIAKRRARAVHLPAANHLWRRTCVREQGVDEALLSLAARRGEAR